MDDRRRAALTFTNIVITGQFPILNLSTSWFKNKPCQNCLKLPNINLWILFLANQHIDGHSADSWTRKSLLKGLSTNFIPQISATEINLKTFPIEVVTRILRNLNFIETFWWILYIDVGERKFPPVQKFAYLGHLSLYWSTFLQEIPANIFIPVVK